MSQRKGTTRKLSFLGFNRGPPNESGHGGSGSPTEVRLDEEMEKVFAMSGLQDDRFDVADLGGPDPTTDLPSLPTKHRHLGEQEFEFHRKKSYPHMHVPLKSLHSRSMMKRRVTSPQLSESETEQSPVTVRNTDSNNPSLATSSAATTPTAPNTPITPEAPGVFSIGTLSDTNLPEDDILSSASEPPAYEAIDSPLFGSPSAYDKRVQFTMGVSDVIPEHSDDPEQLMSAVDGEPEKKVRRKSRHHHSHHHRIRKYSLQEDPEWRKRSGSGLSEADRREGRRVSIQPEDATLEEADIDELTSHRSDDTRGMRRHKVQQKAPTVHIARKAAGTDQLHHVLPLQTLKKMYDHSPHSVFVQLDELYGEGEEREWKETARWIKYEEDVEEGADRWGRPHVASLSFHSLLNLRRCLETGVVLLDLEEKDLPGVSYRVVEQMVVDELIQEEDKPIVMRALLLRHRHVNEHERFRFGRRSYSSYTSLQNLADEKRKTSLISTIEERRKASLINMDLMTATKNGAMLHTDGEGRLVVPDNHVIIDLKEETYGSSIEDLKRANNESILRRIPVGSEATTVLVGSVDFLDQPTIAFVRLAEGIVMPNITEVTIPVRFLFILLGPTTADLDYHEIGRSISTLMANPSFHRIAYKADDRKALLSAINEFLDDSIVLPPGDWEQKALLPFEELKAKSDQIRRRKQKVLQAKSDTDEATKSLISSDGSDGKKPPYDDPLKRTKRPFGGLVNDLKRRYPFFISDFTDGLNAQCVAAAIFMYFAALSGAITFGGLMSDKTENLIGISETLVSTAWTGVLFALFSGQPLVIIGTTGPLLLFDESLFQFCQANSIEYLTIRVYIGIWLAIISLVVVSVEGSVLVKLFTRFTEEIFSSLISLIYIVESLMKLVIVFGQHPILANYCNFGVAATLNALGFGNTSDPVNYTTPYYDLNDTMLMDAPMNPDNITAEAYVEPQFLQEEEIPRNQPNTALFCTILALGTFSIAYYLRLFRNSKFFGRNARRALGDFGVPIAIVLMVALDYAVPGTYTEKLRVPEGLSPSNPDERGWLISFGGRNQQFQTWVAFAAGIPAMLVYILLFMETHICELIIDKKERKLKKGSGFHLDIVLICLMNVGCGIMGAPWVCAATVRSVSHVSALTVMSRTHAPGEKPRLIEVKEQRMSSLLVSILIGVSVMMSPLLRLVPMAVLFGVFLYMGISSTDGIQFFERVKLFFMPVKHHPNAPYVRRVQTYKMHVFTLIQLTCLAILWTVKSTSISLAFPFFLILMVPLRAQMACIFSPSELRALDGDEVDADGEEPDFYAEAPLPG